MECQFPTVPNACLPCIAYVHYDSGMVDDDGNVEAPHDDDCLPLATYKEIRAMLLPTDAVEELDGFLLFPGEFDPMVQSKLASEDCKNISRTLLKALRRNELSHICLSDFDETNVVVTPYGKAKIKGVRTIRNLPHAEFMLQLRRNYRAVRLIIISLFSGEIIPDDILHLLDLIENHFEDREMFHVHASLTPMANFSALYKDLYDHLISVLSKDQMRGILTELRKEMPEYLLTWKQQVTGNYLLKACFDRNKNGYEVPADKPTVDKKTQQVKAQIRIHRDQIIALKSVGFNPPNNQKTLSQAEKDFIEARLFLEYLRNRTSHRMEPLEEFMKAQNGRNFEYMGEGSERVSHLRFPKVVPFLQHQIFRIDKLAWLPMDSYM